MRAANRVRHAVVNQTATTDVIASIPVGFRARVTSYVLVASATMTVQFGSGPAITLVAGRPLAIQGDIESPILEGAPGAKLTLTQTGAGQLSGHISYVLAPVVPAGYDGVIGPDGPAIHYKCADLSGALLAARVGPDAAIASTVTFAVPGLVANNGGNTAIEFDRAVGADGGNAQVGQVAAELALPVTDPGFTHELWVTPVSDVARSTNQNLIARTFYGLYLTPDNKPAIFYGPAGGSSINDTVALAAGTIYHLVYTFDGTTHRVYKNGTQILSTAGTRDAGGPIGICGYPGGTGTANVKADEIALYRAALSPGRAAAHYAAGV